MNLGINLLFLEPGRVGGSETFARELLNILDTDFARKNKVIVYCTESFSKTVSFENMTLHKCLKNADNKFYRLFFETFILPVILFFDKIDILHSMGYTSPLLTHCRKVVTIFDTQFKAVPYTVSKVTYLIYSLIMPLVAKFNNLIVTSSEFSKKEIAKYLKASPSKIKIILGAVEREKAGPLPRNKRGSYIMTSSATHPHKNVVNIVRAYNLLLRNYGLRDLKLFITGFPAAGHNEILAAIKEFKLRGKVKFLGWIDRSKYKLLMRKSLVFVFPSLYEGFGLPPLEAMEIGTPVVVSNSASLPEVVGRAGLIVRPLDPEDIAAKINILIADDKLYREMVEKGKKRALEFSWENSYLNLLKVYRDPLLIGR